MNNATETGRRGGLKTAQRGPEYMAAIGAKGGRNRAENKRKRKPPVPRLSAAKVEAEVAAVKRSIETAPPAPPPGTSIRETALKLAAALREKL